MALIIEQRFPLGRFHATRWNQGAFGDPYGEWPPSPWRLLRALTARWFQYAREMGESKESEPQKREALLQPLLQALADTLPAFYLPPLSWRGPMLKQYQPTSLDTQFKYRKHPVTTKDVLDYSYKEVTTTLNADQYRAVPPDESLLWCWETLELADIHETLLDRLLERTLYFGRAESFSRLRRLVELPIGKGINCRLGERDSGAMVPVLVPMTGLPLRFSVLLAATGDKELAGQSIPQGTAWHYASIPPRPALAAPINDRTIQRTETNCLQFALGGRVFPPLRHWVNITSRFRGRVIRCWIEANAPEARGRYDLLTPEQKDCLALITGKDRNGEPLRGHRHAYLLLLPDESGSPTRLIVSRTTLFRHDEIAAFQDATENTIAWEDGAPEWLLRVVPLPQETPVPIGLHDQSKVWESVTPFVLPAERRRFRKNGRERPGESVEKLLVKLLRTESKPLPNNIVILEGGRDAPWVKLHETRNRRMLKADNRTSWARPAFRVRIEFSEPVAGPLVLGDSCHFGLGLFLARNGKP
jgi:CRISPR-associated protein Csb2